MNKSKRLYRSRSNRVLTGLCGGIGEYFGVDPTLIRITAIILEFITVGLLIIAYLIIAIIVPLRPEKEA